ncbi:MAG TPA: A/G-specific adenine glycosylase [Actinomycetota bacterium]
MSEVMLQQTQAPRVVPAFRAFLERFPDVRALAAAGRADVVRAWGALGYPRRAVALHEAARAVVRDHGGAVPADPRALRRLPGVGPYTASAVASIAYGLPVAAVDTNARRIAARYLRGAEPDEVRPADVAADAASWLDEARPGAWNQALMDLGREVCRPAAPRCGSCPLAAGCRFRAAGRIGRPSSPRQAAFRGSLREVRGRVVAALRDGSATERRLAAATGFPPERVAQAIEGLVRDGIAARGPRGAVRLADG